MKLMSIRDQEAVHGSAIGGKAQNLVRLAAEGIPVPDGWVVPAEAFHDHLVAHGLRGRAEELTKHAEEEGCRELREEIVSSEVDAGLADLLGDLPNVPMAVRSSASVEDQAAASYSGFFRTILGVRGTEEIVRAVKEVWASVFTPELLAYHRRMGHGGTFPAMSVLIMPLVRAEAAGVAFSADPVDGNPLVIVISAVRGLGTSVVDGTEECDRHRLDWESLAVLESHRGTQATGEFATSEGRCVRRALPPTSAAGPAITEPLVRRVAGLVRRIDEILGRRVDVELAIADGEPIVLQARPIVGLPPYFPDNPEQADPGVRRAGSNWPRPLSPFVAARVGIPSSPPIQPPPWPLEVADLFIRHGRMFFRLSPEPEYEERPDAPWEDRTFLKRMWGLSDPADDFADWLAWRDLVYSETIPALRAGAESLLRLSRRELSELDPARLRDLLDEALSLESKAGYLYVAASGATYESLRRIEVLSKDWITGGDYQRASQIALTTVQGSQKLTHQLEMDIDAAARGEMTLEEIACRWGYSYLDKEDMMDLSRWQSWREDDEPLRMAIGLLSRDAARSSVATRFQAAAGQSEECLHQVMDTVRHSDSRDGERRGRIFAACADACRQCFSLKDDRDLVLSHAQSALRWFLMEAARRMRERGITGDECQVLLLKPNEILDWLSPGGEQADELRRLLRDREFEQDRLARYTLPPLEAPSAEASAKDGEVLQGEPASPGVCEGPARIAESVRDVQELQPGDILCLKGDKRVGWTVFFPVIAGLAYEKGNWLCHESNLCRELGIPAVVCLNERINCIRPGERLQLDGGKGTVRRLEAVADG